MVKHAGNGGESKLEIIFMNIIYHYLTTYLINTARTRSSSGLIILLKNSCS